MIILHIASLRFNKSSGLTYAIPPLASYQNKISNMKTALLLTSKEIKDSLTNYDFPILKFNIESMGLDLSKLPKPYNNPNLVIFHSTYIPTHIKIAKQLKKRKIPYIITPHGGMTNGAQSVKKLKKKLGNLLYYNKFVRNALALHCLSKGEADETMQWNKKIFIVGNGMVVPEKCFDNKLPENNTLNVTFIGRLDPYHKGLDLLLAGISIASSNIRKCKCVFDIYGPDYFDSKSRLENLIYDYKIQDIVKIHAPIYDDEKDFILKQTDVFIHTSRFEGHPTGVLEAMAYGVPCLLTPGTNISKEVIEANAGWEVEASAEGIAKGLDIMLKERKLIREKGINARKLVKDKFTWEKIAMETVKNYDNLLKDLEQCNGNG